MKISLLKNKVVIFIIFALTIFTTLTFHFSFLLEKDINFLENLWHRSTLTALSLIILSAILKTKKFSDNYLVNVVIDIIAWALAISAIGSILITYNTKIENNYEQSINYIIQQIRVIVDNPDLFGGK